MKIGIVTTMWQRPEIFRIFGQHYKLLKQKFPNIELIVTGSESHRSKELALAYGFHYVEHANKPLGKKQNKSVLKAKQLGVDYVICIGSDDLITEKLLEYYIKHFEKGIDFIAPLDCYFYDTISKQSLYWGGYRGAFKGMTCGAGRALSANLLNKLGWQPWYDELYSDVLDTGMDEKLKRIKHSRHTFKINGVKDGYLIDIKSEVNMTPFGKWDNSKFIKSDAMFKQLDKSIVEQLELL